MRTPWTRSVGGEPRIVPIILSVLVILSASEEPALSEVEGIFRSTPEVFDQRSFLAGRMTIKHRMTG